MPASRADGSERGSRGNTILGHYRGFSRFCRSHEMCYFSSFMKKRIGVLLSGRGSNFEALAESVAAGRIPTAEIAIVIKFNFAANAVIANFG